MRVVFPSELSFLHAEVVRVDVYDGSGSGAVSPDAICRALSQNPPTPPRGVLALASTGNVFACDLREGGVVLSGVGVGRRVLFVEAQNDSGQAILRGCTVRDVFGDDEALSGADQNTADALQATSLVEVPLAILPDFPAGDASCSTIDDKCEEQSACAS